MIKLTTLLEGFLDEKVSSIAYHITTLENAYKIISSDTFEMSQASGSPSERRKNPPRYPFYMSTARSRYSNYFKDQAERTSAVILTLDGDRLNNYFKSKAIDFFGDSYFSDRKKGGSEMEDRIFSKKPRITNFLKFIKRVDLFLLDESFQDIRNVKAVKDIATQCKKKGIPYLLFEDPDDFLRGREQKAIPVQKILNIWKGDLQAMSRNSRKYASRKAPTPTSVKNYMDAKPYLVALITLYYENSVQSLIRQNNKLGGPLISEKVLIRLFEDESFKSFLELVIKKAREAVRERSMMKAYAEIEELELKLELLERYILKIIDIERREGGFKSLSSPEFSNKLETKWGRLLNR